MGRVIDEDELVEEIKSLKIVLDGKDIFPTAAKDTVLRIISEQPTAYDPDKVVEQLEEAEHNARTMIGFEKAYGSVDDRIKAEAEARGLKHAIEIVKGGGVDAKTDS